jgi:hypothetical protein
MAVLGKKDIFKAQELRKELVSVPEWGGDVWVQEMDAEQRDLFDRWIVQRDMKDENGKYIYPEHRNGGMRLRVLIATVVDENGKLMFSDLDLPDLANKSGKVVARISDVGMKLSGMSEESKAEMTKNSEPVPSEDSSLDSASNLE